jgi:hypothetical protein
VGALAALVGAVVLVAPSGVPAGPSVSQAAALGPRGPEAPAPAPALGVPTGAAVRVNGTEFRTLAIGGRLVVTGRRAGHTCVLSGLGGAAAEMRDLAAWRLPGPNR